jgi:hypothetical protein
MDLDPRDSIRTSLIDFGLVDNCVATSAGVCRQIACTMSDVMTPATIARVPNQPKTPLKSFRIPEALYAAAQAKAAERGETVSKVVRKALERYVKRP